MVHNGAKFVFKYHKEMSTKVPITFQSGYERVKELTEANDELTHHGMILKMQFKAQKL